MLLSLFNHSDSYVPILFDEAGKSATLDHTELYTFPT